MHGAPSPFLLLIPLAIVFGLDYYVFQGFRTLVAGTRFQTLWNIAYWLVGWIPLALIVIGFSDAAKPGGLSSFQQLVFNVFITLFVSKLFVLVFLIGEDIFRFFQFIWQRFSSPIDAPAAMPGRREFISKLAFVVAALPFGSFVYGFTKGKYAYKIHKQELVFNDLPEAFDGFTITQISDVHSGSFDNKDAVAEGIKMIADLKSDLLVFTGDLVNNHAEEVEPFKDLFASLNAPFGKFSVLGNHDYGDYVAWESPAHKNANLDRLKNHHRDMGFRLLLDEQVKLSKNGQSISLLGVENWGKGFGERGDLERALQGSTQQDFKVLLSHDPSHWDEQVKGHDNKIHLTLSGHTHGMQMGVEIPGFKWSPVKYRYRNWAGIASHNERHLYVNRGFGFIGFTGRVGIWPEITQITLRRA